MSKAKIIAITLTALLASPLLANSQSSPNEVNISIGGAIPTGDFDNGLAGGPSLGLEWQVTPRGSFAYGMGIHFNKYGVNRSPRNTFPGNKWSSYGFEAIGLTKFYLGLPNSKTRFYFKGQGGIGTFTLKGSAQGVSASGTQTKGLLGGGFGITFRGQGNTGGHIELLYNALLTEGANATYVTLRGGITVFMRGRR